MVQKKKSRRQNATARGSSSSQAVRSGNSAKKKSAKSKGLDGKLHVRTPSESRLRFLKDAGIIVPEEIPSDEETVPLDFTRLSSRGIGHLQSRYAVRHSHAIFNAAKVGADVAAIKRDLRLAKAQFRIKHKKEKVNVVSAMMEDDDEIAELEKKLAEVEAREDIITALAQGYADIRDAASREITRRTAERASVD